MIKMFDKVMNRTDRLMYGVLVDEIYTGGEELYDVAYLRTLLDRYNGLYFIFSVDDVDEQVKARLIVFDSVSKMYSYILMHKGCGDSHIDELWLQIVN